jgi:glycosyltransferase involved in cell wall biosynthesis
MLTPLLDQPRPRLGKSLIKYYETAVAGALGIFSDTPQYQALPAGLTCIKAANDAESWYQALKTAIEMKPDEFDRMRRRCLEHVREEYSVSAQIDLHEAALRAVEFHARTRGNRHSDGCPRVMYVLHSAHYGGGEIQLLRRLRLVKRYGIQPVVVIPSVVKDTEHGQRLKDALALDGIQLESAVYMCFTEPRSPQEYFSELEREQIRLLLERCAPALVHTVTFIPSFGQVCQEMGIPHVSTQYAIIDEFAWNEERPDFVHCALVQSDTVRYTNRWAELLGVEKLCSRDMAPESLFHLGQANFLNAIGQPPPVIQDRPVRLVTTGTFQERKQQLETIEAAGRLKKKGVDLQLTFYGYTHFFPEYMKKCHQAIKDWNLEECVSILEFTEDLDQVLSQADILLSLSTFESFPGSLKDAMAAGVLVVATPVGGIPELIVDNVSGVLCAGTSEEELVEGIERALNLAPQARQRIAEQARRVAILELHPRRTANDLFRMYNRALEIVTGGHTARSLPIRTPALRPERHARARIKAPASPPASLMPIGAGLIYTITPDQDNWSGIDVLFETNARTVTGQLRMQASTPGGDVVRTAMCEVNNLREASWLNLRFPAIKNAAGQNFQLVLKFDSIPPGALVSLYQSSPARRRAIRAVYRLLRKAGRRLPGGQLHCQLWYDQE